MTRTESTGWAPIAAVALAWAMWAAPGVAGPESAAEVLHLQGESGPLVRAVSVPLNVDRIFMSMKGPYAFQSGVRIVPGGESRRLHWITGASSQALGPDGETPESNELLCHVNVELEPFVLPRFESRAQTDQRFFTFVPGQFEVRFPAGFGIPVYSDEDLRILTMALNLNRRGEPFQVRYRTDVHHVAHDDLQRPMKALFRRALYGFVPDPPADEAGTCHPETDSGIESVTESPGSGDPGEPGCGPAPVLDASGARVPGAGPQGIVHWFVPPGRHSYRSDVTGQLQLPFPTTAHFVMGHLHPYAERLVLRDRTTGEDVVVLHSSDYPDRVGVQKMEQLASEPGIPVYPDREYELVADYHNVTDQPVDAMAILYLYLQDRQFSPARWNFIFERP